jgi:hypothetical protein
VNIFPVTELSDTEQHLIAEKLQDSLIKKYFHLLAYNIGKDLVTSNPEVDESPEQWIRKEIFLKGQLRNLDMLLSIETPKSTSSSK